MRTSNPGNHGTFTPPSYFPTTPSIGVPIALKPWLKMNLQFILESRSNLDVFSVSIVFKNSSNRRREGSVQFQNEKQKFRLCASRSPKHSEFGHVTFFCRGRQKNEERFVTHVQSYWSCYCRLGLLKVPIHFLSTFSILQRYFTLRALFFCFLSEI